MYFYHNHLDNLINMLNNLEEEDQFFQLWNINFSL